MAMANSQPSGTPRRHFVVVVVAGRYPLLRAGSGFRRWTGHVCPVPLRPLGWRREATKGLRPSRRSLPLMLVAGGMRRSEIGALLLLVSADRALFVVVVRRCHGRYHRFATLFLFFIFILTFLVFFSSLL
jgi:hypothetical protein